MGDWRISQVMKDPTGYVSPSDVERMLAAARQTDKPGRNELLILFLWRTGRRITEVVGRKPYLTSYLGNFVKYGAVEPVRVKDVDFINQQILFSILKKRKPVRKYKAIDTDLIIRIGMYILENNLQENDPLFSLTRRHADRIVKRCASLAGIYQIGERMPHCHNFRHGWAVNMIRTSERPEDIKIVQNYLDHQDPSMTFHYLQFGGQGSKGLLERAFGKK